MGWLTGLVGWFGGVSQRTARASAGRVAAVASASLAVATPSAVLAQAAGAAQHPADGLSPDEKLPIDDRLVTGELDNGLSYIVRSHSNPPGKVGVWLHIKSGSMNESDEQRGLAHFLEHMAFNGSENFKPFEVVDLFQSLGMTFGQDQNAFTSFDQTAYQLYLPDADRETLEKGFTFFADVAERLTLAPEEIENERGVILEERRTRLGPEERVQNQWLKRFAPGSLVGERLPIGVEETIKSVDRDDFVEYYEGYYVPENMTVLVVGDLEPKLAIEEIEKAFGELENREADEPNDPNVKPYTEQRSIVAHDPELTSAQSSLLVVDGPDSAVTDVASLRRELTTRLALTAFNRRIMNKVSEGTVSFQGGGAFAQNLFNAMRIAQASVSGQPADWPKMLEEITVEVRRASLHGFGERETSEAQTDLLSSLEQTAEREATYPARVILGAMAGRVQSGDAIISPADSLEYARKIVPTITKAEVNERFTELFDLDRATFLVTLPTTDSVPEESKVLELGAAAASTRPEPELESEVADALMDEEPEAGEITELAQHASSGVWSAWLDNGVRVHHRYMDERENDVTVQITMAGGELLETPDTRGLSQAAVRAWDRAATRTLTSSQIRGYMAGVKASVSGGAGDDALTMGINASPDDLETGFQLAHVLLTEPLIEPVGFEQWRTQQVQALEAQETNPIAMLGVTLADAIYPEGDPRGRPLTIEQVKALKLQNAQEWLDRQVRGAPMEVSIVGDIDRDRAFALAAKYLGSLSDRDRVSGETYERQRQVPQPGEDDIRVEKTVETRTPQAMVVSGFFAADASDLRDSRLMNMASRALTTRLIKAIREEARLVYSIRANFTPGESYPGYGLLLSGAPTDPAKTDELASAIGQVFQTFAEEGPSEEEIETVKKQLAKQIEEAMEQPGFWAGQLGQLDYRDRELDNLMGAIEAYNAFSAADVKETFSKYHDDRAKFTVIVKPAEPSESESEAAGG
ncbi:MAG: hypothetical protein CMJ31_08410 [Phycisphaerae bacterium]|nr:hypothetical protein [Phycisphaerae bacterium]